MSEAIAAGRLHPSSVLFRLTPHVRALIIPGLAVLLFSSGDRWQIWLMLMFVPSTIYELGQYFTLRYQLRRDELVVRSGLFWKRERHIPIERIHGVDLTQGPLHRLFRVAEVRLETAGGDEPEAVLRVLGLDAFEALRESVSRARGEEPYTGEPGIVAGDRGAPEGERTILRLKTAELVKLGIVSMRGAAAAAILIGLAWEFDLLDRLDLRGRFGEIVDALSGSALVGFFGGLFFGIALLLVAVSIVWSVLRLYDFHLVERGDDLRLSCGLLTRVHATVPQRRIQLVSVISSPVRRLFGRVSVRVETAGGSAEQEGKKVIGQRWFIPLLPTEDLPGVIARLARRVDLAALEWRPLSARAFRRAAKPAVLLALIPTAIVGVLLRPWGVLSVAAFVPLMLWLARAEVRRSGYALFPGGIAFRSGVVTRRLSFTFFDKIQAVSLDESPFDRRRGMATVDVDTAGAGAAEHRIRIPYLERETALAIYGALVRGAGGTEPTL